MKKLCLFLLSFIYTSLFAQSNPLNGSFHFNSYKLNAESEISAARLNHPITEKDRITVSKDGHLEANGERIRIWGTNLSEFPKSKEQAEWYAKALADQGYNCIRFHHTDASWTDCFLKKNEAGKYVIDKKNLDRFDYFFAKLKENGIYSNINFLTGRYMSSKDGYKPEIDLIPDWKARHDLAFWNQEALDKQQEYIFDLMTHVNPYTGTAYKDDPAVAIVEINNENGLLMGYLNKWFEEMEGEYWTELEEQWNSWLKQKGITFDDLSNKYDHSQPVTATLIDKKTEGRLEQHQGAKATVTKKGSEINIKVEKSGTEGWHIQYNYPKLSCSEQKIYTLSFSAKASKESRCYVSLMQAHDPYKEAGFGENLNLTTVWKDYKYTIEGPLTDDNLRINIGSMGLSAGTTFSFKNITFVEGGASDNISRSSKNPELISLPHFSKYKTLPAELKTLIMTFLWEKEEAYWLTMIDYVRKEINSKALIMGTAAGCSTSYLQSAFDIIDSHAYWNHPSFPVKDWDMGHYYVKNKDLTRAGTDSTLTSLAKYRVYGKPFSVSEYDHPYPNQYLSQDYPMISSFACLQDWDLIFTFCSEIPKTQNGQKAKINGYFDQSNNPAKACASPFAARIFRQFLIEPAITRVSVPLTKEQEINSLNKMSSWAIGNPELYGSIPGLSLKYQLGLNLDGVTPQNNELIDISLFSNDECTSGKYAGFDETEQFYWNQNTGTFIVCNKNVSISIMSKTSIYPEYPKGWFMESRLLPAKPAANSDFICVAAVKDILSTKETQPYFIFSCSWVGNTDEKLRPYDTKFEKKQIFRDESVKLTTDWSLGTAPVKAFASDAYLYITTSTPGKLYATELEGNRAKEIKAVASQEFWSYQLKKDDQTLWYILE